MFLMKSIEYCILNIDVLMMYKITSFLNFHNTKEISIHIALPYIILVPSLLLDP